MINANELRVGNKFMSCFNRIETVLTIMDNTDRGTIEYKSENHKLMYSHLIIPVENRNQYKPCEINHIPLTPEILEKAGFKWLRQIMLFKHEKIGLLHTDKEFKEFKIMYQSRVILLNYVHQLQNLYFALTGQELEINL